MIFQSNCSYWTLFRPKYSWAWAGTDDTSAKTGAKSTAQRVRSRVMNCPADEPQQKSRVERRAAGMLGARPTPFAQRTCPAHMGRDARWACRELAADSTRVLPYP